MAKTKKRSLIQYPYPPKFIVVDLFCGAGGTTTGFEMTGGVVKVIAAVNHDKKAIKSHWRNHKHVKHFEEDIRTLDLTELIKLVQRYRIKYPNAKLILWASLECTNFSKAKGGQAREADSRTLADHLDRYVSALLPDYIQIENVVEFMSWGPLDDAGKPISRREGADWIRWRERIRSFGYYDQWREMNSADFGGYTSRNRLFGCFALHGLPIAWPEPTHSKKATGELFGSSLKPWMPVKHVLDFTDEGKSIFDRSKPLSEKTLERIYAGLVKYVAGGKDAFLAKTYAVASNSDGTYPTDRPAHTITTRDAHNLVQAAFLSTYNGENPEHRNKSVEEPCKVLTTANAHALVQSSFIAKYYSGRPDGKVISTDGPAGTITCIDSQSLVQPKFIVQRNGGNPEGRVTSVNKPARTLTSTGGNLTIIHPCFIHSYYSTGDNNHSIDSPAPTIRTKDGAALIRPVPFIYRDFSSGDNNQSIERPAGALLSVPKISLVQPFVMNTNFSNKPSSIEEPHKTITADRHWSYLINPSWGGNPSDTNKPCPVIVARQDKAPLYIICAEGGYIGIRIDEDDSPCMRQIKEFMVLYNIIDIKMRMLKVAELLKIQGFPADYHLEGNQSDQKKFIGNSVHPLIPKKWAMAMGDKLTELSLVA